MDGGGNFPFALKSRFFALPPCFASCALRGLNFAGRQLILRYMTIGKENHSNHGGIGLQTFIRRPILSGVLSVMVVLLGIIGLVQLPVEQFPEIAPPTIRVSATYTGANAETLQKAVVAPLEEAINGVENINYMTSSATNNGTATISVYFRQGTDPDMAAVNVQNRIASAQGVLPAEVIRSGITVRKSQNSTAKIVALYSPKDRYDQKFLYNYYYPPEAVGRAHGQAR